MSAGQDFRKKAVHSLLWSAVQSWGSKLLTFVLFIVLARLLTPVEFGVAAAGFLVLTVLGIFAEFGFGEAVIQRPDLKDDEVNLPFFISMGLSIVLGVCVAWNAPYIEHMMGVAGLSPIIVAVACLAPFNTAALFQEALYKRHTLFKQLALRTLTGTAVSGVAACCVAFAGFGVWALIVQVYVMTLINLIWLWSHPVWKPTWRVEPLSLKSLVKYSGNVFGVRVIDFAAIRSAELIIVTLFGAATLGLYSAGIKLYQTILFMLQTVFGDVALAFLAKIAHDRERMAKLYLNTTTTSIALISPVFVVLAALAPEISHVLFGEKWASIDQIVRPFFLLGAIQCTQAFNGSFYGALGRPNIILYLNILKLAAQIPVFLFCTHADVFTFVPYFCIAQTVVTLPSFYFVAKLLNIKIIEILGRYIPFLISSFIGFFVLLFTHAMFVEYMPSTFMRGVAMGAVFVLIYAACVALIARKHAGSVFQFIKRRSEA